MSVGNNYGGGRRLSENDVYDFERFTAPNNYTEYDINLFNRLVQTTNSLLYDGSCSVCSTPDSTTNEICDKNSSLPNLLNYSSEHSALKSEDINLSCEDCNIMEELIPYPTHLSLYEIQEKNLSNSITTVRNTHRYDEFLTLNTDEQTDVDSCEQYSESEFVDGSFGKSDSEVKNVFYEEIDNLIDNNSATLQLLPKIKPNHNSINCPIDSSKFNSASGLGTSYCPPNDHNQRCEVTSEEASPTFLKYSEKLGHTYTNMSRYEIMKQRKIAKNHKKHCKNLVEVDAHAQKDSCTQKSIEQLVSFIEGKDVSCECRDLDAGMNCSISSLIGSKKSNKKKKNRSVYNTEAVCNITSVESTSLVSLCHHAPSKNSCLETEMSLSIDDLMTSSNLIDVKNCDDAPESKLGNLTSTSWGDSLPSQEIACSNVLTKIPQNTRDPCHTQPTINANNCNVKADRKTREDLIMNSIKDFTAIWSEASRCDVVDGFPEIVSASLNSKDVVLSLNTFSNCNFNNCNNNDLAKLRSKTKVNLIKKNAEDDDKFTEFSYSTNTNSSGDELSSKESELEEFVMVQKKKKTRIYERSSRSFKEKLFLERKKMINIRPEDFSKLDAAVCVSHGNKRQLNGVNSVLKTSDLSGASLISTGSSLWERGVSECSQTSSVQNNAGDSLTSSNATSPDDDSLSKRVLIKKFKNHLNSENPSDDQGNLDKTSLASLELSSHSTRQSSFDDSKSNPSSLVDEVKSNDVVFFDTRHLNKSENSKKSSDISFIYEESKNVTGTPKKTPECRRSKNTKCELNSGKASSDCFGDDNNNVECFPVDVSTSCSSEDCLNLSDKDKSLRGKSPDIQNCIQQPNILLLPKPIYPLSDDLVMQMSYLPYGAASPYASYPVSFPSSPECIVDQGRILSQDSDQFLGNSPFQLHSSLPMISSMYAPYNCYLTVMPSINHDAPFLANHPDIGYGELTFVPNEDEMSHNYSSFPYHRKLDQDFSLENGEGLNLNCNSSLIHNQFQANHILAAQNTFSSDKCNSSASLNSKENQGEIFTVNMETKQIFGEHLNNLELRNSFKNEENRFIKVPFRTSHLQNLKRSSNKNNFNTTNKNHYHHHRHHSDFHDEENYMNRDISYHCGGHDEAKISSFRGDHNNKMVNLLSVKKVASINSFFNLEGAQIYLLDLFESAKSEENCGVYCEE